MVDRRRANRRPKRGSRPQAAARAPDAGSTFEARARDLTSDGRAVLAHPDGRTFFCPGLWPGEQGRFRVEGQRGGVGLASLVERLSDSPARVAPVCPHHGFEPGRCGGCPWQFVTYAAQLKAKQERAARALAALQAARIEPIKAAPKALGYRNRAQLRTDGDRIGYVGAGSHRMAPIEQCPVLSAPNRRTLSELLERLPNPAWRPPRPGTWNTLNLDETLDAGTVRLNARLPFRQGNDPQNAYMRDWLAGRLAAIGATGPALELFCGSGNFTEILSLAGCRPIVAADAGAESVAALVQRDLAGVRPVECDLYDESALQALLEEARPRLLLLDPPRDGLRSREALRKARTPVRDLLYVSCNLATFERDAGFLRGMGYRIELAQPVDLFPQTPHLELLAHFRWTRPRSGGARAGRRLG